MLQPEDTLCYCFHISRRKVVNFLRVRRPKVASQIAECGGAGTGCGWCVPFLKKCFRDQQRALAQAAFSTGLAISGEPLDTTAPSSEAAIQELDASTYAQARAAYIRAGKGKPAPGAIPLPEMTLRAMTLPELTPPEHNQTANPPPDSP
jgi:bacterioferritin-associated ferredoxin